MVIQPLCLLSPQECLRPFRPWLGLLPTFNHFVLKGRRSCCYNIGGRFNAGRLPPGTSGLRQANPGSQICHQPPTTLFEMNETEIRDVLSQHCFQLGADLISTFNRDFSGDQNSALPRPKTSYRWKVADTSFSGSTPPSSAALPTAGYSTDYPVSRPDCPAVACKGPRRNAPSRLLRSWPIRGISPWQIAINVPLKQQTGEHDPISFIMRVTNSFTWTEAALSRVDNCFQQLYEQIRCRLADRARLPQGYLAFPLIDIRTVAL